MCPDLQLLSAWVDGEVSSPWRERISQHLEACGRCSAAVSRFRSLDLRLKTAALSGGHADEKAMVLRVGNMLEATLAAAARSPGPSPSSLPSALGHWWRRRISLSLPVAAALGALLLGIGGFGLGVALGQGPHPALASASQTAKVPAVAADLGSQDSKASIEEVLRYLEQRNSEVTLTIKLPSDRTLDSSGSPVLMVAPMGEPEQGRVVSSPPPEGAP